jgi:hypothetical protein
MSAKPFIVLGLGGVVCFLFIMTLVKCAFSAQLLGTFIFFWNLWVNNTDMYWNFGPAACLHGFLYQLTKMARGPGH